MKNNKKNKAKNQVSSEVSRTDVLDATDVSRETLSEKEQRQAKKEMAKKVEHIEAQYARLQDQYTCIRGMFSECLEKIEEIRDFVRDS